MIKYILFNTSKDSINEGEMLNILAGAVNDENKQIETKAVVWGKVATEWKELVLVPYTAIPKEHKHLYIQIPGRCFTKDFWETDSLEEMELVISEIKPEADDKGHLIFIN